MHCQQEQDNLVLEIVQLYHQSITHQCSSYRYLLVLSLLYSACEEM